MFHKGLFALLLAGSLSMSSLAHAEFVGEGGTGANKPVTTIQQMQLTPYDDMEVVLEGNIVRQITHDKYLFRDTTGEVVIEVDHMPSTKITPQNNLRIYGTIDVNFSNLEVEVDMIELLPQSK